MVVHLARNPGKHARIVKKVRKIIKAKPKKISSCREAKKRGITKTYIKIYVKGKKHSVHCNHKIAGGGWTQVSYRNARRPGKVIFYYLLKSL